MRCSRWSSLGRWGRRARLTSIAVSLLALVGVTLTLPGSARAAYLMREIPETPLGGSAEWRYLAADGETNHLTVRQDEAQLVFADAGADIHVLSVGMARGLCAAGSGSGEVVCRTADPEGVSVNLGEGDDSATVNAELGVLAGGAGDDQLEVIDFGIGLLDGGSGRDMLIGSRFTDVLMGGPDSDRITGGGGLDTALYVDHQRPVSVDLRRAGPQGSAGEGDTLVGIQAVVGGFASDRLVGNARANRLEGGFGNDVLSGGPGNDELHGSLGNDRLDGGPGRDEIEADEGRDYVIAADGRRDTVNCGPGRDSARVDRFDRVIGCERVVRVG
jgi:Ca2+-binding RTX toxin-like protein